MNKKSTATSLIHKSYYNNAKACACRHHKIAGDRHVTGQWMFSVCAETTKVLMTSDYSIATSYNTEI
jgi:hypothetical protein